MRRLPEAGWRAAPGPLPEEAAKDAARSREESGERATFPLEHAADEELLLAFLDNRPHAARAVWERFSPMVRRIARRTLGPVSDAEDLVQDVFMQLFVKAHTLREPKVLRAFIISIATLTLRRELRRRKLRSWLGLRSDPLAVDLRVVHPDPVGRAALERFYAVLDRLDARERTAFALRCIDGMALSEVAEALGVSLATTKRCLARAQRRVLLHVERDALLADYLAQALRQGSND